jgi:hypothetical protein
MSARGRKVLLIGATGYDRAKEGLRLDCVPWDKLSDVQNVRDYDVLFLNLLSIGTEDARAKVDWVRFAQLLDFRAASDILTHGGRIVILGDPRFEYYLMDGNRPRPFLEWTGAHFVWDDQPGDTVLVNDSHDYREFKEYAKHLRKWQYSLRNCCQDGPQFSTRWHPHDLEQRRLETLIDVSAACVNRYEYQLAFSIRHVFKERGRQVFQYGPIYLLPQISLGEDETLLIVLRDFCDAASDLPEPGWVSGFEVPGQKAIDDRITQIQTQLTEQQSALSATLSDRVKVRECLKLLYEREYALEPLVRNILRQLGATVEDPVEKNKEDGWVTIQISGTPFEGVLEIKSAKSDQFNEEGRRQVSEWIERGREMRGKNYKGIFIGNSAVAKPVDQRPDAFSDSWKKAAKLSKICAMKSEDLFRIYVLHKRGKVTLDTFWTKLFATDGIFDIKPFIPKKTEKGGN